MRRIDKNRSMLANKIFLVFRTISERNRFTVNWNGEISLTFPVKPTKETSMYFRDFHYLEPLDFTVSIKSIVGGELTGETLYEIRQSFYCGSKEISFHVFNKMRESIVGYKIDIQRQIIVESFGWLAEFERFFHFLGIVPDFDHFNEKEYFGHNNPEMIG